MIAVPLPSLADDLDRLPLQWSDPTISLYGIKPRPEDFVDTERETFRPRGRRGYAAGICVPYGREYMRLYMARYRRRER